MEQKKLKYVRMVCTPLYPRQLVALAATYIFRGRLVFSAVRITGDPCEYVLAVTSCMANALHA